MSAKFLKALLLTVSLMILTVLSACGETTTPSTTLTTPTTTTSTTTSTSTTTTSTTSGTASATTTSTSTTTTSTTTTGITSTTSGTTSTTTTTHPTTSSITTPPTWSIVFYLGEGTLDAGVIDDYQNFETATLVDLPTPFREGYEFYGWYLDPETWTQGPYGKDFLVEEDVDLYARWELETVSPTAFFSAWNHGVNHVFHSVLLFESGEELLLGAELVVSSRTLSDVQLIQTILDLAVPTSGNPESLAPIEIIEEAFRRDEAVIGEYRYLYERSIEEPEDSFYRMGLWETPEGTGTPLDLLPFDYLYPEQFIRIPGTVGYQYDDVGGELVSFAASIINGPFLAEEVQAAYNGDGGPLIISIPILPRDPETDEWGEVATLYYSLEDPDMDLEFPIESAKEVVSRSWETLYDDILGSFPQATPQSKALLSDEWILAQNLLPGVTDPESLYDLFSSMSLAMNDVQLEYDPLYQVKSNYQSLLDDSYAALRAIATDSSVESMDLSYDEMSEAMAWATSQDDLDALWNEGWQAIRLAFAEDPQKAAFERLRKRGTMWVEQFGTMALAAVSPADSHRAALEEGILQSLSELSEAAYAPETITLPYQIRDGLWYLFGLCESTGLEDYRTFAMAEVDRLFFETAIEGSDEVKAALWPFVQLRDQAHEAIQAASTFRGIWDALVGYAGSETDQAVDTLRDALLTSQQHELDRMYYRTAAGFRQDFIDFYLVNRDLIDDAVLSLSLVTLSACFDQFVADLTLDPLEDAKRVGIEAVQDLLLIFHPRATDASQSDMYIAQTAAYDQIYVALTPAEALNASQAGQEAIMAVFVTDWDKTDLLAAKEGASVRINDEMRFYAWFTTDYPAYADVIVLSLQAQNDLLGCYSVEAAETVESEWRTAVAATGYQLDSDLVDAYRTTILDQMAQTLAGFSPVPSALQAAYDEITAIVSATGDPLVIRSKLIEYMQIYYNFL